MERTKSGTTQPSNQADATSQRWQGTRSEADSGLDYMNARYYDPEPGQFISPDTITPDAYRPQSLNPYSYTENDGGINAVDPSGHMPMRVELKKEQELQGQIFASMYSAALAAACMTQGGACPAALAPRDPGRVCISSCRITDRKPSGSGPGGRFGTYFVRDDETGATCSFNYADIVTEGFRTTRTGERVRFLVDPGDPGHAIHVIRLDLPDVEQHYE